MVYAIYIQYNVKLVRNGDTFNGIIDGAPFKI